MSCRQKNQDGNKDGQEAKNPNSSAPICVTSNDLFDAKAEKSDVNHKRNCGKNNVNFS